MSQTGILLVDDSITVRMDLSEALEAAGLAVTACTSVAEAQAALAGTRFGLIVLDVLLPDGDGVELLEQIRETPALAGVAVILLSDEAAVRDRIRGLVTGADEYIGKPYDARYVVACAQELLRRGRDDGVTAQQSVLVIDDSPTFRAEMAQALEGAGYRVLDAASGEAGLRLAAQARPDAIILDRVLPGIDGVAVLSAIRLDAALRQIPCILLTAAEAERDEVAALDAGADAFVRKDEDIAIILARLHAVLRKAGRRGGAAKPSLQGLKRILMVDADASYLRQVTGELRAEGYEVVQARSGEEAFDLISAQPVDAILLDLDMPGIGSCETCRRIKSVPFASLIPVIVTAARDDRDAILRCLEAGADDYIAKSGDFAVLRARLLAQIRRRQFADENRLIREQRAVQDSEAAKTAQARELGEVRGRALERCRAQLALADLSLRLARGARRPAMALAAAQLSGEIAPALAEVAVCLDHARRAAGGIDTPQRGHLLELLARAEGEAGRAAAGLEAFHATMTATARCPADVNEIVREIAAPGLAGGWSAELEMQLAPSLPPVAVDREQIAQVLVALLRNGLEAMREAPCRELKLSTMTGEAGAVRVAVRDSGCGVAGGDLFAGAMQDGLDLAICRAIMHAHGGRIWSCANPAAGLTVLFELPAA